MHLLNYHLDTPSTGVSSILILMDVEALRYLALKQLLAAGIVRDSDGKWVTGFCRKLGLMSTLSAELFVLLREGLQLLLIKC